VVMCWIDETEDESYYSDEDKYTTDLTGYQNLLADLTESFSVKSVCLVPDTTIEYVLPPGYSPPSEISVETCGESPTKAELITDFENIRDGAVPDCVLLLADRTHVLSGFSGLGSGYVDFKAWLKDWLNDNGLDPTDKSILPDEKEFGEYEWDERWIDAMTVQIQDVLDW